MLGKGHAALLRRAELKTFVDFHGNEVCYFSDFTSFLTEPKVRVLELSSVSFSRKTFDL